MFEKINIEKKKAGPSRAEQEGPSRAEQRAERHMEKQQSFASLHLFSIGNYFHSALLSESKFNPKIII